MKFTLQFFNKSGTRTYHLRNWMWLQIFETWRERWERSTRILKLQRTSEESTSVWKDLRWTEEERKKREENEKRKMISFSWKNKGNYEKSVNCENKTRSSYVWVTSFRSKRHVSTYICMYMYTANDTIYSECILFSLSLSLSLFSFSRKNRLAAFGRNEQSVN